MQNAIVETNSVTTLANVAVESNVVQLDTTSSKLKSFEERLDQASIEASVWEKGAYADSNTILYGVFKKAYELYRELTIGDVGSIAAKKQSLKDYMANKAMNGYEDKPLTQKIIRCVFGNLDRRRISTYHTVLRYIVAQKWDPAQVVDGIKNAGGVQEISLGHPKGYISPKNRAAAAGKVVSNSELATVTGDKLAQFVNVEKIGDRFAAVLTQNSDGSFTVNCIVSSNTAVNATLAAYYSKNKAVLSDAAAAKLESDMAASAEDNLASAKAA